MAKATKKRKPITVSRAPVKAKSKVWPGIGLGFGLTFLVAAVLLALYGLFGLLVQWGVDMGAEIAVLVAPITKLLGFVFIFAGIIIAIAAAYLAIFSAKKLRK